MTREARAGSLFEEPTTFIGRQREVAEIQRLMTQARLVTLTGVGGVGKTRLVRRIATGARRAFSGRARFVDLTEVHESRLFSRAMYDPDTLAQLVASTLGLPERDGESPTRRLIEHLTGQQLLLILDNCEHLLPPCAQLTDTLVRACPDVRVLATSREPLNVQGEQCYAVPPLPAPQAGAPFGEARRYDAITLFADRARTAAAAFRIDEDNWPAVAELCRRLDGLPLAIELAAARVAVLTPSQILQRLTDRFALLTRGYRTSPTRHQALRACVDWSFDLCEKAEQLLWSRLTVFVGGFDLDAVEGVCADDSLPADGILDLLTGLLNKSVLVRADTGERVARYRMLETIREYARDKLAESEDGERIRQCHADWYAHLVDRAATEWISDRQVYWHARLTREHPNVRAAIDYYLDRPDQAEAALSVAVTVPSTYWWRRGLFRESRQWLDRALAGASAPTALRARALLLDSHLTLIQGDAEAGERLLHEGEELLRGQDDVTVELSLAAYVRGITALYGDDLPTAIEAFERMLTILPATPTLTSGREMELRLTGPIMLGVAAAMAGDNDRADACHRDVVALTASVGETHYQSAARWPLALTAWRQGRVQEAAAQLTAALRLRREPDSVDRFGAAQCLECLAWVAGSQRNHRRAATLLGAADALWTETGLPVTGFQHLIGYHDACERLSRDHLGDAGFDDAFILGRALSYDGAVAFALDEQRRPPDPPAALPTPLTRREQQVAELVGQGLSNKQIAARLVISQRTAESHIDHILSKLNLDNRAQIAAWITRRSTIDRDP